MRVNPLGRRCAPEAIERENKNGKMVWETHDDYLEGYITGIKSVEKSDWSEWQISVTDGKKDYILSLPYSGGTTSGFLVRIESVDFSQPVKICPYYIQDEEKADKYRSLCGIIQSGEKIQSNYNKENDYNGLPELKKIGAGKNAKWDDSERMEFFEKMITGTVLPAIAAAAGDINVAIPEEEPVAEAVGETEESQAPAPDDDLPF